MLLGQAKSLLANAGVNDAEPMLSIFLFFLAVQFGLSGRFMLDADQQSGVDRRLIGFGMKQPKRSFIRTVE
jgi:hypothetical protein